MSPALAFYMYIDHCTQDGIDLCSLVWFYIYGLTFSPMVEIQNSSRLKIKPVQKAHINLYQHVVFPKIICVIIMGMEGIGKGTLMVREKSGP